MGAQASTNVNEAVKEAITDMSTKALNESVTSNTSIVSADQIQEVIFTGKITCDVSIEQNANVENTVFSEMTDEQTNDFKQLLENRMNDAFENLTTQQQEDLVLFQANVSTNVNKTRQKTINDLSTEIAMKSQSVFNNEVRVNQQQKVSFVEAEILCNDGFHVGQNVNIKNIVKNVMKSVFENKKFEEVKQDQGTDAKSATTQSQKGLSIPDIIGLIIGIIVAVVIVAIVSAYIRARTTPNSSVRKWKIFSRTKWPPAKTTAYGRRRLRRR